MLNLRDRSGSLGFSGLPKLRIARLDGSGSTTPSSGRRNKTRAPAHARNRALQRGVAMSNLEQEYEAVIWTNDPTVPGKRATIFAEGSSAARKLLEEIYGEGNVFNVHNEEDAAKPRCS